MDEKTGVNHRKRKYLREGGIGEEKGEGGIAMEDAVSYFCSTTICVSTAEGRQLQEQARTHTHTHTEAFQGCRPRCAPVKNGKKRMRRGEKKLSKGLCLSQ